VRIAVVGTGGVAQRHLGALSNIPDVQVVGHVSESATRAREQAERWGGRAFSHVLDLVQAEQPDAAWVCVTPDRHGPLELALVEAGVPFFVEKPLSADLATAEQISQRLTTTDLVTAVGYKFRALDTLPRVRELLLERAPRMVLAVWHDRMPPPLWWRQASRSGGQIVEQATHLLDLARVLVGEAEVIGAFGRQWPRDEAPGSDVPDVSTAMLRYSTAGGPVPGLLSATCLLRGAQAIHLQLVCQDRVLTFSERSLVVETGRQREEHPTSTDPFVVEDRAFIDAVRNADAGAVLCSYADALQTHRLACAVRDAL
jgi:myo-inositol 2-dehydrogenase/D-chiro-inositol 1-dehydrogenase